MIKLGKCQIYIEFNEGFFGRLRPSYDSAATTEGELTAKEVRTLIGIINRYVKKRTDARKIKE